MGAGQEISGPPDIVHVAPRTIVIALFLDVRCTLTPEAIFGLLLQTARCRQ
jgi:hypothetical protein